MPATMMSVSVPAPQVAVLSPQTSPTYEAAREVEPPSRL